jgi:hypothetical protein
MEYVEGETLQSRIARRALGIDEALRYAIAMADAVSAVHCVGIVHRDLKPGNIVISAGRNVKLLDFGLAKFSEAANVTEFTATQTMCTREGQILGTVFMSPEQAEARCGCAIRYFGWIGAEMITGRRPFDGNRIRKARPFCTSSQTGQWQSAVSAGSALIDRLENRGAGSLMKALSGIGDATRRRVERGSGASGDGAPAVLGTASGSALMWWGRRTSNRRQFISSAFGWGLVSAWWPPVGGHLRTDLSMPLRGCIPAMDCLGPPLYRASMPAPLRPFSPGLAAPGMCWRGISGGAGRHGRGCRCSRLRRRVLIFLHRQSAAA